MEFSVRPGHRADLEQLVGLTCDLARETEHGLLLDRATVSNGVLPGLPTDQANTGDLCPRYWVAEQDGAAGGRARIVGFVAISPEWSDWWATSYWWVTSVFVAESHRRIGVGRELFTAMFAAADAEKIQTINLRVEQDNQARRFYSSIGFVVDESHLVMSRGNRPDGTTIDPPTSHGCISSQILVALVVGGAGGAVLGCLLAKQLGR